MPKEITMEAIGSLVVVSILAATVAYELLTGERPDTGKEEGGDVKDE